MSDEYATDTTALTAAKEILEGSKEAKPYIPEHFFVDIFLPMFAGEVEMDMQKWLLVAEHPHNAVEVLNQNNGEVLFTVPPMMRDVSLDSRKNGYAINEMVSDAINKGRLSPRMGNKYLESNLTDRLLKAAPTLDDIDTWNEIFARYDKPTIDVPDELRAALGGKENDGKESSDPGRVEIGDIEEL